MKKAVKKNVKFSLVAEGHEDFYLPEGLERRERMHTYDKDIWDCWVFIKDGNQQFLVLLPLLYNEKIARTSEINVMHDSELLGLV